MGTCRLLLLGPPRVEKGGQSVPIVLRKAVALAAYLAVEQRPFSREHLAALLWPDHDQEGALANLRRTLSFLRERLGDGCISAQGDQLQIDRDAVTVDVDEFHSSAAPTSGPDPSSLEAAAALYRGSFLEGFSLRDCVDFDEWQRANGERLAAEYDSLLETLTTGHLQQGHPRLALPFARRWLELDHANQAAHRALIEIHARTGRTDLARKQFETCTRALALAGLELEQQTRELREALERHRLTPVRDVANATADPRGPRSPGVCHTLLRRHRHWIAPAALVLVAAVIVSLYALRFRIFGCDLSVSDLEVRRSGNELSSIRVVFQNDGIAQRGVAYAVVFSSDSTLVAPRDYVVYSGELRIGSNAEVTVEVDRWNDIAAYLEAQNASIPPGDYSPGIVIDPGAKIGERSKANNTRTSNEQVFFSGTDPSAAFSVEIGYRGLGPLKVFIGDRTFPAGLENWGRFVVSREGRYYFPVDDIPRRDNDGSGYFLIIVRDAHDDLGDPKFPGVNDVAAIYKQVPGGLVYGVFGVGSGSPIHPGVSYVLEFSPPPTPSSDAYEVDDVRELGTLIDYADLPVRQLHTFHDEGTGDTDEDWFRIRLGEGDSLAVETYSADGRWECDTAIGIADADMNFIDLGNDKSQDVCYSRLAYVNDTGIDQVFHLQVRPYNKYDPGVNRVGEYIVEFRD